MSTPVYLVQVSGPTTANSVMAQDSKIQLELARLSIRSQPEGWLGHSGRRTAGDWNRSRPKSGPRVSGSREWDGSPKSTTKPPETRKKRLPASTLIRRIQEPARAKQLSWRRLAGRQIDSSDRHSEKAKSSILEMAQPASKVNVESCWQLLKQSK
jgi:hypothetical protein